MYASGQGLPQDYVLAHLWANLAAVQGNVIGLRERDDLANKMTPQQVAEAQKMARECLSSGYKRCD